jgi:hypothetical protein
MKSIELTKEHKTKLLEMCKALFPEMFVPTIQDNGYINYSETGKTIDYDDRIHWFEFCMTHLANKIINTYWKCHLNEKHYKTNLFEELSDFYLSTINCDKNIKLKQQIHPIDYLYEEFKKLK